MTFYIAICFWKMQTSSSLEVNLELVPSQVGTAILNLGSGEVLKVI